LKDAEIVAQVDKKFILIKTEVSDQINEDRGNILVIVDQHAADERIRVESLMEELCSPSENSESGILTRYLDKPIVFEVSRKEITLLLAQKSYFSRWGILYDLPDYAPTIDAGRSLLSDYRLQVRGLPPVILERCRQDPRLVIDMIRTESWKAHEAAVISRPVTGPTQRITGNWLEKLQGCPQGILDLVNSRACRSAIMFNDQLTEGQCKSLVRNLAKCKFPFQCAHGRPSLVPLVDIGLKSSDLFTDEAETGRCGVTFSTSFRRWKEEMIYQS